MTEKRQVCFTVDKEIIEKMEKVRETTGIPVSKQIELTLKGYEIKKKER
ncbi:MAG: ribbon-helix-helix domain-containing protein [Candidatus Hydrothermarchaeales archaeon]